MQEKVAQSPNGVESCLIENNTKMEPPDLKQNEKGHLDVKIEYRNRKVFSILTPLNSILLKSAYLPEEARPEV